MKKCKYCHSEMGLKSKNCPTCGKTQKSLKWLPVVITLLIIIVTIYVLLSLSENQKNKASDISTDDTSIQKFSYEVKKEYAKGSSYYIEGTIKNNKNKTASNIQIDFICYDELGNNLGTAMASTNELAGKKTWNFKATFMGDEPKRIHHCDYYQIVEL